MTSSSLEEKGFWHLMVRFLASHGGTELNQPGTWFVDIKVRMENKPARISRETLNQKSGAGDGGDGSSTRH